MRLKTNNLTLNDILSDPVLDSYVLGETEPGVVIIDTNVLYPVDLKEVMEFGVQFDTNPEQVVEQVGRCNKFKNYFFHYKVCSTLGVARESVRMKRTLSRRIKQFKDFRDKYSSRKWSGSELVNVLSQFEHEMKRMVNAVAGAVYLPSNPELYGSIKNLVSYVADQKGLSLGRITPEGVGKKLRTDEGIVAMALYLSLFEKRPSNIITRDIKDVPPLFYETKALLEVLNPEFCPDLQRYMTKLFVPCRGKENITGTYRLFNKKKIRETVPICMGKGVEVVVNFIETAQDHYSRIPA